MTAAAADRADVAMQSRGIVRTVTAFVVVVCLSIVALDGLRTYHARAKQLQEGATLATNLVQAIAQHASDALKESDGVVMAVISHVDGNALRQLDHPAVDRLVHRFLASNTQIYRLSIVGADGRRLYTSLHSEAPGSDATPLAWFAHHRDHPSTDAYLGPMQRSDVSGQWVLTLSRRFDGADGRFGGVVVVDLELDYFRNFHRSLDIGAQGTLVLATSDGTLVERRPWKAELVGSSLANTDLYRRYVSRLSEGVVEQVSALDHVERQIAYKNLDDFPLYVVAALSTRETLAAWTSDAILHTTIVGLLVAGLGLGGFLIVRQVKVRGEVEAELQRSKGDLQLLNEQLFVLAREDGLTGLRNRRELDRVLREEISRTERTGSALSLILLDVDFFKAFNDRYGHLSGDHCLRQIGMVLSQCVHRPGDVTARFGGEEFAVVLPGTELAGAMTIARKVCGAIRELDLPHASSEKGVVTVSAGVAVFATDEALISLEALISAADAALYLAKDRGRDRIEVARTSMEESAVRPLPAVELIET